MNKENKDQTQAPESAFGSTELVSLRDDEQLINIPRVIDEVKAQVQTFKKIVEVCLGMTVETDWVKQGEKWYLMDSGSEKVAIAFGIQLGIVRIEREDAADKKGAYYTYTTYGKLTSTKLNRYLEDIGTCSSRDKLFGRVASGLKEIEEVDVSMIKKKAVTNCYNRMIKRCCGIINITDDQLTAAGLKPEKIEKIEYKEGSKKAAATLSKSDKEKKDQIWKWCLALANGNEKDALMVLGEVSYFKKKDPHTGKETEYKVSNIAKLNSPKYIDVIHKKAKERYEKFQDPTDKPQ